MKAIQPAASSTSTSTSTAGPSQPTTVKAAATTNAAAAPIPAATSKLAASASNRNAARSRKKDSSKLFHSVIPIAPNLVTLSAFRKLLLHRRRLVELASLVPQTIAASAIPNTLPDLAAPQAISDAQNAPPSAIPNTVLGSSIPGSLIPHAQNIQKAGISISSADKPSVNSEQSVHDKDSIPLATNAERPGENKAVQPSKSLKRTTGKERAKAKAKVVISDGNAEQESIDVDANNAESIAVDATPTTSVDLPDPESKQLATKKPAAARRTTKKTWKPTYENSYEYHAVSGRFTGLFMWPALLSSLVARFPAGFRKRGSKRPRSDDMTGPVELTAVKRSKVKIESSSENETTEDELEEDLTDKDDYHPKIKLEPGAPVLITRRSLRPRKNT